jgi:AGZA family xanthine/uracil permease-like MFS transporter
VAGDDYRTRDILLVEALATILAGVCGGVAQSTPYIGHSAYKRMGARTGYALLTGLFIGLGGVCGYVPFFVELIPRAVLAPILVFVGLDIMVQSFQAVPRRHFWAVAFAFFPTLARMLAIKFGTPEIVPPARFQELLGAAGKSLPEMLVTVGLGNGFILTAMLWGGFLAELIDHRLRRTAAYLFLLAALAFFGIVHSALPDGAMYLPWELAGWARAMAFQFALGYAVLGLGVLGLSWFNGRLETEASPAPGSP